MTSVPGPHVGVLGPVTVDDGAGAPVQLTRKMEIAVLGLLALHAGSPVASHSLIDLLWPDDPPRTAAKTVQGYVKRVRGIVAAQGAELSHAGSVGYVLRLGPDQVDATRFESLVADARTSPDDAERRRCLDEALALWRGEPFAGCDLDGLEPHREWLLRLRSAAQVERVAAQIRLGVSEGTIGTIRGLLREDPTDERLWVHLVGASFLRGHPVAALEAITEARRELAERAGVDLGRELRELQRRLLDDDEVEHCYYHLTGQGAAAVAPHDAHLPPVPAPALPVWGGDLVGREAEVAEIVSAIEAGAVLLTLVGPGGMGKTRCAVEAARRARTPCRGFVDLSAMTGAREVALHLAGCFGVPVRDDPVAAVAVRLAGQRVTVVLDNVEQIPDIGLVLAELVRRCPSVVWVVTSQTETGVEAERLVRLRPLSHQRQAGGSVSAAAALLGAAAARRGVDDVPAAALEDVAALIGGIPLALELAACQLQHLDPPALVRALEEPLDALVDPHRAVGRHRSMRACLDLGLVHLDPDSTDLLAVLSRRPNGCRYDDLAAGWTRRTPFARAVAGLVEMGYASTRTDGAGATRLTQLPVVRAFGRRLPLPADAEDALACVDRGVLARAQAEARAPGTQVLEPDLPDIRRALQQGLERPEALEGALQLAAVLTVFWWSARITEGRQWLGALLARAAQDGARSPSSAARPYATQAAAFLDFYVGDAESARARLDGELAADVADAAARSRMLALRAMLDAAQGEHATAVARADEALALARAAADPQSVIYALGNGADVATAAGQPVTARERYVECIERLQRARLSWLAAAPHARLGDLELSAGEHGRARMWFERSIALWSSREPGPGAPQALAGLARLDVVVGDLAAARRHLDTALATAERCGSRGEYPWVVLGYAAVMAAQGRRDEAAVLFGLGLRLGSRSGHWVRRLVDAELAPLYREVAVAEADGADPRVLATPLEDVPLVVARLVAA